MRWNDPKLSFTRPIRWLVALLGRPGRPGRGVGAAPPAGRTRVHRTGPLSRRSRSPTAEGYLDLLRIHGTSWPTRLERRAQIVAAASELAGRAVGGTVDVEGESALVDQITNLVEEPTAILGASRRDYLDAARARS